MFKEISGITKSMLVVLRHLFKKPVTLEYPESKIIPNDNFRGMPEVSGCIGCSTCMRVCPANAIIVSREVSTGQLIVSFDLKKCIFCGNCAYYCPKGAIKMTKKYELAVEDKNKLMVRYKQAEKE